MSVTPRHKSSRTSKTIKVGLFAPCVDRFPVRQIGAPQEYALKYLGLPAPRSTRTHDLFSPDRFIDVASAVKRGEHAVVTLPMEGFEVYKWEDQYHNAAEPVYSFRSQKEMAS